MEQERKRGCRSSIVWLVAAFLLFWAAVGASQDAAKPNPNLLVSDDLKKYPGLLPELAHLAELLQKNIELPPVRTQSDLLPHLPSSTTYYIAFPNYGETAHQTLETLRQELQASAVLRDWWQHGELKSTGPKLQDFIEKYYEISQYLGDEVVVSGDTGGFLERGTVHHSLLIVAPVRKPGLQNVLRQITKDLSEGSPSPIRILDLQELALAKSGTSAQQLVVLVRPDFVIATESLEALRAFNAFLDAKGSEFASTPFGQRLTAAYQGGTSALMAADLRTILNQIPAGTPQNQKMLDRTGIKDAKYVVWDYRQKTKGSFSRMELSFVGPRRGVASWLAAPAPLGSLEFVSPQAAIVSSVHLKNLGDIFDDIKDIASSSNPNALASITQSEKAMHISLKDDLLGLLTGEITVEAEGISEPNPKWKMILRTSDANHLQQTLTKLLATMPFRATQTEEGGITYHSLTIPSALKPTQIVYTFAEGYLIVASSQDAAAEALRIHRTGESFAKFAKFKESLPAGYSSDVSALLYEDPAAVTAMNMRRLSPEMSQAFARISPPTEPIVFRAYGDESAIRGVSTSGAADASAILVVAAIAIPNLMRARMSANEASAIATMHTVAVAQVAYSGAYPEKGYAPDLASLGPNPRRKGFASPEHAGFIDAEMWNAGCTSVSGCSKSGYNFALAVDCKTPAVVCREYVVVGTPLSSSDGTRSFCSTSDGVVRFKFGPPLTSTPTPAECRRWLPVH